MYKMVTIYGDNLRLYANWLIIFSELIVPPEKN